MHVITIYGEPNVDGSPRPQAFSFPAEWAEVTAEQLATLAKMLSVTETEAISRYLLLQHLAGIPNDLMTIIEAEDVLQWMPSGPAADPLAQPKAGKWRLLPSLDWCFEQPVYRNSLLRTFDHGGFTWSGPDDRLACFTLARFAYCDSLLSALSHSPDEAMINKLLAALYQPQDSGWSNLPIETYAAQLADLPASVKLPAILNYRALRGHMAKTYWRVFAEGGEEPLQSGLFGMIYDVCASGLFGDIDRTEQQSLLRVMGYMQHRLEKDERELANAKSNS